MEKLYNAIITIEHVISDALTSAGPLYIQIKRIQFTTSGLCVTKHVKHVRGILDIYPNVDFITSEDAFVGLCLKHMGVKLTNTPFYTSFRYRNHTY